MVTNSCFSLTLPLPWRALDTRLPTVPVRMSPAIPPLKASYPIAELNEHFPVASLPTVLSNGNPLPTITVVFPLQLVDPYGLAVIPTLVNTLVTETPLRKGHTIQKLFPHLLLDPCSLKHVPNSRPVLINIIHPLVPLQATVPFALKLMILSFLLSVPPVSTTTVVESTLYPPKDPPPLPTPPLEKPSPLVSSVIPTFPSVNTVSAKIRRATLLPTTLPRVV